MGCGASTHGGSARGVSLPVRRAPEVHPDAPVQEILEVMRGYSQLVGLQEEACLTLGNRATNEEFVQKLVAERGVEDILTAMRNHSHHSGLQGQACAALYNLAGNASVRSQLTAAGGIHDVLSAMRNFSNIIAVQHRCLAALSHLAMEANVASQIVADGGVGDIVGAMRANKDHAGLQEAACYAICSITQHKKREFQVEIGAQSGVNAIISAIQNHRPDAAGPQIGVQVKACLALFYLAHDEDNTAHIFNEGGVEAVLSSMRQYRAEMLMQQAACALLQNLARSNTEERQKLAELGAAADILAAMQAHQSAAPVQLHAAQALWNMADETHAHSRSAANTPANSPSHAAAIEPGNSMLTEEEEEAAMKALIAGMRELGGEREVQRCGLRALAVLLTRGGSTQAERFAAEGGVEVVLAVMEQHTEDASLLTAALKLTCAAVACANGCQRFGARQVGAGGVGGGIEAVLAAMWTHAGNSALQQESCRVLLAMAQQNSAENTAKIVEGGGIREVVGAMRRHEEVQEVQELGCGVLAMLAAEAEEEQQQQRVAQFRDEGAGAVAASARERTGATEKCREWAAIVQEKLGT
mmetsp:Transcript_36540/g.85892  ORF Transcript_36540/g.85892 Transcript_36540/m.85892 type:complete len:585 (-) Transcript_36540:182-1936(-)